MGITWTVHIFFRILKRNVRCCHFYLEAKSSDLYSLVHALIFDFLNTQLGDIHEFLSRFFWPRSNFRFSKKIFYQIIPFTVVQFFFTVSSLSLEIRNTLNIFWLFFIEIIFSTVWFVTIRSRFNSGHWWNCAS